VALAWLIAQGAVPIPGAKNGDQAQQNAGALGWHLTTEELELLNQASLYGTRTIQQRIWQHG
jgi:pyridoxine 4-dehydrogenase